MRRINIDNVRVGDILFTARTGKISSTIRKVTQGSVSHAMICVQRGSVVDSTQEGVQARNLQREIFEDDEEVFHFRLKEAVTPEVMSIIINYARKEIGTRYSITEAMQSVLKVKKSGTKRQFCSRFVARAYNQAGIKLVENPDYCSPETLRQSPLIEELPIEFEIVSDDEFAWWESKGDPTKATRDALNTILDVARSIDPNVDNFEELFGLLIKRPDIDNQIATALKDSGYLDLWRNETDTHPWRYDHDLIDEMTSRDNICELQNYCIRTVVEAYSGGHRYSTNLIQFRELYKKHRLVSVRLEIELYERLVRNHQMRREVAYNWLSKYFYNDLRYHMEQIEPHTSYWYSFIDPVEPILAAISRQNVKLAGSEQVCTSCADTPTRDYRLANDAETMPGVPSLRLCEECVDILRNMGNELVEFLPPLKGTN